MVEAEKETKETPYQFSTEERTCPKGLSKEERRVWFDERIRLQQEGIEHGVKPQNLYGLPSKLRDLWISQVWNRHLRTLSKEDRRAIRQQTGPSTPRHTRPFARDRRDQR